MAVVLGSVDPMVLLPMRITLALVLIPYAVPHLLNTHNTAYHLVLVVQCIPDVAAFASGRGVVSYGSHLLMLGIP